MDLLKSCKERISLLGSSALYKTTKLLVLLTLSTICILQACGQSEQQIFLYLLEIKGKCHFYTDYEFVHNKKNEKKFSILKNPHILPQEGLIRTRGFSSAYLQLDEFLTVYLEEKTELYYKITPAVWKDSFLFEANFVVRKGSVSIFRNLQGLGSDTRVTVNHSFLPKEKVVFKITQVIEKREPYNINDHYITVLVKSGALHYISPITEKIDMYIMENNRFTGKNKIPLEISQLKDNEKKLLGNIPVYKPLNFSQVESILAKEQSFLEILKRRNWLIIAVVIITILSILIAIKLIDWRRHKNHSFEGMVKYWSITKPYLDIKKVYFSFPKKRTRIFIGKKGYCQIRLPNWKYKRRMVIKAFLAKGKEFYTVHNWRKKAIFLKRSKSNWLSWGDKFEIDEFVFEFMHSDRKNKIAKKVP
jgi:hypothetical protein